MLHHLSIRELPGRARFRERDLSLLLRVFRSPSPNHGERMIGKRYMRWCTKKLRPGPEEATEKGSSLSDRIQRERGWTMEWMSSMSKSHRIAR